MQLRLAMNLQQSYLILRTKILKCYHHTLLIFDIFFLSCTCVHVYTCAYVWFAHECSWQGQGRTLDVFLYCSLPYCLKTRSLTEPAAHHLEQASWPVSKCAVSIHTSLLLNAEVIVKCSQLFMQVLGFRLRSEGLYSKCSYPLTDFLFSSTLHCIKQKLLGFTDTEHSTQSRKTLKVNDKRDNE